MNLHSDESLREKTLLSSGIFHQLKGWNGSEPVTQTKMIFKFFPWYFSVSLIFNICRRVEARECIIWK